MTEPVTLYNGYYLIDTGAWLAQRIGVRQVEHSVRLQDFVRCDVFDDDQPSMDMAARLQLWCAAHGYPVSDGAVIHHDDTRLTRPVTIVLATSGGLLRQALALVSVDGATPDIYADRTTDDGYWQAATTISMTCTGGHAWTWDGDRHLHTADGTEATVADVFGRDDVISRCRDCAAYDDDTTDQMCWCPGFAVYCPTCGERCQIGLPEIAILGEDR